MAETITDLIADAIGIPDRRVWLDPADTREIAEDVARTLGYQPSDSAPPLLGTTVEEIQERYVRQLASVISDPGRTTPRRDGETVAHWAARALTATGLLS